MNKFTPFFANRLLATLFLTVFLIGCGGGTLQSVELHGYQGDRMTMKWLYQIGTFKLDDGSNGFREETQYLYRESKQQQGNTVKAAFLNSDYSLSHSEKTITLGDKVAKIELRVDGNELVRTTTVGEEKKEDRAPISEPIYTEIPPILFSKELTEIGDEKIYRIFSEKKLTFSNMVIKLAARREIKDGQKTRSCLQYQLVGVGNWFLDAKDKQMVRIEMDDLIFVKP